MARLRPACNAQHAHDGDGESQATTVHAQIQRRNIEHERYAERGKPYRAPNPGQRSTHEGCHGAQCWKAKVLFSRRPLVLVGGPQKT